MKNRVTHAIARVLSAIIYADGYLSPDELHFLKSKLEPKYELSIEDFQHLNHYSFAEAIQVILSSQGGKWLESHNLSLLSLAEDMEQLAKCDGFLSPKEAMICLCTRLTFEKLNCSIISTTGTTRLAKSDIIYVEQNEQEKINDEILKYYDNILYILHSFGFNFIYIPKVREEILNYSKDYRRLLLNFLFPESKNQESLNTMILTRLPAATTTGFSLFLLESILPNIELSPSLLLKLPSNHIKNLNEKTDFALLKINDGFLQTIQSFFVKFNALTGRNSLQIQNGSYTKFLYRGFHKTFIDYLHDIITDVQIHLTQPNFIRFGNLSDMRLSRRLLATYITLLYFNNIQKPFCKDWKKLDEQYDIFEKIYKRLNSYNKYSKEVFYTYIQSDYGKIVLKFSPKTNKYLLPMIPIYSRETQTFYFTQLPPIHIVTYNNYVPKYTPLVDWVNSLEP